MGFARPKWAKVGMLGFQGSGKTYTAISIAVGIRSAINSKRPLKIFDTEGGIGYQLDRIVHLTGMEPEGVQCHSFSDLIEFTKTWKDGDVVVIDSITHPWRELLKASQKKSGRFQGIMRAKDEWVAFTNAFLSSPCHIVMCGRAGYTFEEGTDDQGKEKLITTGTKMKTETELGFEPSLLIEMEREDGKDGTTKRTAIIKKDRFGVIDGMVFEGSFPVGSREEFPTYATFAPHFERLDLLGATPKGIDVSTKSDALIDANGQGEQAREYINRDIQLEEIKNVMVKAYPGQTAEEKRAKIELLEAIFGTSSWTKLEKNSAEFPSERLRNGKLMMIERLEQVAAA